MKRIVIFVTIIATNCLWADNYSINDHDIDMLFSTASEVTIDDVLSANLDAFAIIQESSTTFQLLTTNTNPWQTLFCCFFLSNIGFPCHYINTKSNISSVHDISYCGIFGIVFFVDWIGVIISKSSSAYDSYIKNEKILMWQEN